MSGIRLTVLIASVLCLVTTSFAADCYEITGWVPPTYVGSQAILLSISCVITPPGTAWLHVDLNYDSNNPPNDDLYLRIATSDSHMSGGTFSPLLFFSHYDVNGLPVVITDLIIGPSNSMQSTVNPPNQGAIVHEARVRLRHRNTGNCLVSEGINGAKVKNFFCADDPDQVYVLIHVGAGEYRLQHEATVQCLYTGSTDGDFVYNWACWADPNMRFKIVPQSGGYRLHHVLNSQCVFGNPSHGGFVHTWSCWEDPNMVYQIDIIEYPPSIPPVEEATAQPEKDTVG